MAIVINDRNSPNRIYYGGENIVKAYSGEHIVWPDEEKGYLTFVALGSGTFKFTNAIEYSLNNGLNWTGLAANTDSPTVSAGSKILWRGTIIPNTVTTAAGIGTFSSTVKFNVQGNPMSLLYGDRFDGRTLTDKENAFNRLFSGCGNLVSAKNLLLPATTLVSSCYQYMFVNCNALTEAPELPATTLANNCYTAMFQNCTALTEAPELPATTLAGGCYSNMFRGCAALTKAPELPATTLAGSCYYYMFRQCTSLTTAPSILPATTLATNCYEQMFYYCTALTTAPELPATTLAEYCYTAMFQLCENLKYIKCLATTNIPLSGLDFYKKDWVNGVASSGTFVKAAGATWPSGPNGIPNGWSIQNA